MLRRCHFLRDLPTYIRITDINDDGQFASRAPRVSVDIERHRRAVSLSRWRHRACTDWGQCWQVISLSRGRWPSSLMPASLIRVRPNPGVVIVAEFLAAYLSTWSYWDWVRLTSARSGQPGINGSEYASMPLTMPTDAASLPEQRKIADCFAVLDEGIAAQRQRLRALRCHKNGLLQQLFPTPEAT